MTLLPAASPLFLLSFLQYMLIHSRSTSSYLLAMDFAGIGCFVADFLGGQERTKEFMAKYHKGIMKQSEAVLILMSKYTDDQPWFFWKTSLISRYLYWKNWREFSKK